MDRNTDAKRVYYEKDKFEIAARQQGFRLIAGVDEAGRGPVAGPIYAAAVILDETRPIWGLNDSKKLTEKKREDLFEIICAQAKAWSIASLSAEQIDQIGIQKANHEVMQLALRGLETQPDYVLIDHLKLDLSTASFAMSKGDFLSNSIAAASILAKVARDREMILHEQEYPGYGFAKHKGYGTRAHKEALAKLGLSPLHRKTFLGKWLDDLGIPS